MRSRVTTAAPKAASDREAISRLEEARELMFDLRGHGPGKGLVRRQEERARRLVMLGLGQEIRGRKGGLPRPVRDDDDLAGAGDHVDRHPAEDHLLGRRHIGVSRADDLVDAGDRSRAVRQGRDRLGAADLEDPMSPRPAPRRRRSPAEAGRPGKASPG